MGEERYETGGWVAPFSLFDEFTEKELMLPEIKIDRGGIMYPMPQLAALVVPSVQKRRWRRARTVWHVRIRQYGQDGYFELGPYTRFEDAKNKLSEVYAWYSKMYNVIIRTYKATERNKK